MSATSKTIQLSKEAWSEIAERPELRELLGKFDVSPSAGQVHITPSTSDAAAKLDEVLRSGDGFQLRGGPRGTGEGFNPHLPSDMDPSTGMLSGNNTLLNPPALRGAGGLPATQGPRTIDVPARTLDSQMSGGGDLPLDTVPAAPGFSRRTKLIGGAAVGAGALGTGAYLASGDGDEPAETTSGGGGAVAGGDGPSGDEFQEPTRERPRIEPQTISAPAGFDRAIEALGPEPPSDEWTPADEEKFNGQIQDLKNIYREAQKRNQWSEVAERVGHALTQFFAARQGMRTGTDLSGLKFDKTDWARKQDQLLDQLKFDVGLVDDARRRRLDQVKSARDALDKWRSRKSSLEAQRAGAESSTARFNAGQRQGADQFNASIDKAYDMQAESLKTADAREAERKQEIAAAAAEKAKAKREKDARQVVAQISLAKSPGSMSDKNMQKALEYYIESGLGTMEDFEKLVEESDTAGWTWDDDKRKSLVSKISGAAGLSGSVSSTDPAIEAKIDAALQANPGATREQIIQAAQTQGVIPNGYK